MGSLIIFHNVDLMWMYTFFISANMIAAVTVSIDNLIVLAAKEQQNSKGKNCLA